MRVGLLGFQFNGIRTTQCGLLFSSAFVKAPRLFRCDLRVLSRIQDDRVQDDAAIENGRISSLQPSGRRTALVGKWGSTFWKDCQPMQAHGGGSESGQESKSGSEYKSEEGSEGDSSDAGEARAGSEDDDEYRETEKVQRDHVDVPVDEMLSDDYYEQDGDDQSDSLPYRPVNHSGGYNSKPQSRSAANNIVARNSRTANGEEDDEDADSDEDVNDGDDPDDADFDPEYGAMTSPKRNKIRLVQVPQTLGRGGINLKGIAARFPGFVNINIRTGTKEGRSR